MAEGFRVCMDPGSPTIDVKGSTIAIGFERAFGRRVLGYSDSANPLLQGTCCKSRKGHSTIQSSCGWLSKLWSLFGYPK